MLPVRIAAVVVLTIATAPACRKEDSSTGSDAGRIAVQSKKCVAVFTTCSCSYNCEVEGSRQADCAIPCNPDAAAAPPLIKCAWHGSKCEQAP